MDGAAPARITLIADVMLALLMQSRFNDPKFNAFINTFLLCNHSPTTTLTTCPSVERASRTIVFSFPLSSLTLIS